MRLFLSLSGFDRMIREGTLVPLLTDLYCFGASRQQTYDLHLSTEAALTLADLDRPRRIFWRESENTAHLFRHVERINQLLVLHGLKPYVPTCTYFSTPLQNIAHEVKDMNVFDLPVLYELINPNLQVFV